MGSFLAEDRFDVKEVDFSRFQKCGRILALGSRANMKCELDINTEVFAVQSGDTLDIKLTDKITKDGSNLSGAHEHDQRLLGQSLLDDADYACYGIVYKIENKGEQLAIYASFGGLLLRLTASHQYLDQFRVDLRLYLLISRV